MIEQNSQIAQPGKSEPLFGSLIRRLLLAVTFLLFLWCAMALLLPSAVWSEETANDEVDLVALAALLIKDGHLDRAEAVLRDVDPDAEKTDKNRYHSLMGILHLHFERPQEARTSFNKALATDGGRKLVYVYLAQAEMALKNDQAALDALDRAGEVAATISGSFMLRARANWRLERRAEAWKALADGEAAYPQMFEFARQRVYYLIDLQLYREAVEQGLAYLERSEAGVEDYVALGEALRRSGQLGKAKEILEIAQLIDPGDRRVLLALARVYLDDDFPLIAARLMERAAIREPRYVVEAAELYRRAGKLQRALYLNAQMMDQKAKVRQRVGLLLQAEHYETAAGMAARLSRLNLLQDEDLRYAMAYAHFKIGDFSEAENYLAGLTRADLFQNANQLRKAMAECGEDGWQCR